VGTQAARGAAAAAMLLWRSAALVGLSRRVAWGGPRDDPTGPPRDDPCGGSIALLSWPGLVLRPRRPEPRLGEPPGNPPGHPPAPAAGQLGPLARRLPAVPALSSCAVCIQRRSWKPFAGPMGCPRNALSNSLTASPRPARAGAATARAKASGHFAVSATTGGAALTPPPGAQRTNLVVACHGRGQNGTEIAPELRPSGSVRVHKRGAAATKRACRLARFACCIWAMRTAIFSAPLGRAQLAYCPRKQPSVGRQTRERLAEAICPRLRSAPRAHQAAAAPRFERAQRRPEGAVGVPHHRIQRADAPRRALDARRTREGAPVAQKHARVGRRGRRRDQQRAIPAPVAIILCGDAPAPRGGAQNREQRPRSARFLCACHAHPGPGSALRTRDAPPRGPPTGALLSKQLPARPTPAPARLASPPPPVLPARFWPAPSGAPRRHACYCQGMGGQPTRWPGGARTRVRWQALHVA
jgi:hypothetical protein